MMVYKKIERQLLLYEILFVSYEVEIKDLMKRLNVSEKTIRRDIKDLTDAGLINLFYSKKEKSYRHEEVSDIISESEETAGYFRLRKLRRLVILMHELSGATEISLGEEYNFKERYFELFPEESERTRMRDYKTLNAIGYTISWDKVEKRHLVEGHLYQIREEP